jgi:O-antigen ligase
VVPADGSATIVEAAPGRTGIEAAAAVLVGLGVVALLIVAGQAGAKGLAVTAGGLAGLSVLAVVGRWPDTTGRLLLFVLALSLSISLKFHPVFVADHLGGAIGIRVSLPDLTLGALVLLGAFEAFRRGWLTLHVDGALATAAAAYLVCATASTLASEHPRLGWFQIGAVLQALAIGVFLSSRRWEPRARRVFVAGMLAALLLQSGVALVQSLRPGAFDLTFLGAAEYSSGSSDGLPDVDVGATTIAGRAAYRPTGLLIHPNLLAAFIVLTLPAALVLALTSRRPAERMLAVAASGAGAIALYLSLSRSGWAGMLLASAIGGGLAWRWRAIVLSRAMRVLLVVALTAAGAGLALKAERIYLRLTETANDALEFRRAYALTAWRMAEAHPLLGVGLNTFTSYAVRYDASGTTRLKAFPVHNAYLLELAETGFPGGLAFAALVAAMLAAVFGAARRARGEVRPLVLALAAGLAGFWLTQVSDYFYRIPVITSLVWAYAGLAIGLARAPEAES